jgi:hypothetical protein
MIIGESTVGIRPKRSERVRLKPADKPFGMADFKSQMATLESEIFYIDTYRERSRIDFSRSKDRAAVDLPPLRGYPSATSAID